MDRRVGRSPFQLQDLGCGPDLTLHQLHRLIGGQELLDLGFDLVEGRALGRSGRDGAHDIAAGEVGVVRGRPPSDVCGGEQDLGIPQERGHVVDRVRQLAGSLSPSLPQLVFLDRLALRGPGRQRRHSSAVGGGHSLRGHRRLDGKAALTERSPDGEGDAGHFGDAVPVGLVEQAAHALSQGVAKRSLKHGVGRVALPVDGPAIEGGPATVDPPGCVHD